MLTPSYRALLCLLGWVIDHRTHNHTAEDGENEEEEELKEIQQVIIIIILNRRESNR